MTRKTAVLAVFCAALAGGWAGHAWAAAPAVTDDRPAAATGTPGAPGAYRVAQAVPPECVELMNSKPEDLEKQLEWFKELRKCIEQNRDLIAPSLVVDAPGEVDAGADSYTISGYVGDDGSTPALTINGEPVELVAPGADAPDLGANTLAFSRSVAVSGKEGEHRYIFEAVDAGGNSVAEERVVVLVAANRPKFKGKYFALIIGNGEYDFMRPLETAVNDANAVAKVLMTRYVFDKENVQVVLNATRRDILSALSNLKKALGRNDRLLIFYSGHGYIDEVTGVGFWQAVDADEFDDFTWVSIDSVTRNLAGMQAKHALVIADSVFPVAVERGTTSQPKDRFFETIDSYASRKLITSGVVRPTPGPDSGGHSVFVHYLLEVLADNDEPYITSKQLYDRLTHKIAATSDQKPEWGTVANAGDEGSGEFTFILRSKPLASAD